MKTEAHLPRLTVGSISDLSALNAIDSDHTPQFDVLEIRLDGLEKKELTQAHSLALRVKSWGVPILITARDMSEGGIHLLSIKDRCERLREFAEVADYVDVEIANYRAMEEDLNYLQSEGIALILSYHNFDETPTNLKEKYEQAISYGANIPKFAVMHHSTDDLKICCDFIKEVDSPISLMGMGDLAPVSRVLYAQLGSVLNYGYLGDIPTAPGQWSAAQLKQAISTTNLL